MSAYEKKFNPDEENYQSFLIRNFSGSNFKNFMEYLQHILEARKLENELLSLPKRPRLVSLEEQLRNQEHTTTLHILSDSDDEDQDDNTTSNLSENIAIPKDFREKVDVQDEKDTTSAEQKRVGKGKRKRRSKLQMLLDHSKE